MIIMKIVYDEFTLRKCLKINNRIQFATIFTPYNASTIWKFNFF